MAYAKLRRLLGAGGSTDPRVRPHPAIGGHRRRRARSLSGGRDRTRAGLRPGGAALGRLDSARRHALQDAGLGRAGATGGAMGLAVRPRPHACQDARRGDLFRAVLLALSGERRPRRAARGARREHVGRGCLSARPVGGRPRWPAHLGRRRREAPRADRPGDPRAVRRQSAGDRPVSLPHGQLPDAVGRQSPAGPRVPRSARRISTLPTWNAISRPSDHTST